MCKRYFWLVLVLVAVNGVIKADRKQYRKQFCSRQCLAVDTGLKSVQTLITDMINTNSKLQDDSGNTVLHYAAKQGGLDIVRYLVTMPDRTDYRRNIALGGLYAANANNNTPLHKAAKAGHSEIAKLLLKNATSSRLAKNCLGCTPLHLAAMKGHTSIVKLLIEAYAGDINQGDNVGYTALHWAAANDHLDIVKYLVKNGAKADMKNNNGFTARELARNNRYLDIVDYFQAPSPLISRLNSVAIALLGATATRKTANSWRLLACAAVIATHVGEYFSNRYFSYPTYIRTKLVENIGCLAAGAITAFAV